MAETTNQDGALAPPGNTSSKEQHDTDQTHMLRTISMDIREEREHLKKVAEQSMNAILELELDGKVKWASASWKDVTGKSGSEILGKNIADVLVGSENVFAECVESMRNDDSKSRIVRFSVMGKSPQPPADDLTQETALTPENAAEKEPEDETIDLEAQGIMVYDRQTGQESHTMWMVRPAISREITIDLPTVLVETLGVGAEVLVNHLTMLTEASEDGPQSRPNPLPVLCRICERQITPWWFEKHTELCAEDHRAEVEVQEAHDALNEQRSALVKVLDALDAQTRATKHPTGESGSPTPVPKAEYKGLPIGPNSVPSSGHSSGRSSPAHLAALSRESSVGHQRAKSFLVRRPLARIVELVLDLCDTAMEINTPSVKDSKACAPGEIRTQSPQSENHIQQVLQWQSPSASALENEQGLAQLCDDTSQLAKAKVDAVFRHRRFLEYFERIRIEYEVLVAECIEEALQKADRLKAGDISDSGESSEDSSHYETPEQQLEPEDDTIKVATESGQAAHTEPIDVPSRKITPSPSSMAMALRNASDPSLVRRPSSVGSSRTSSPHGGAATPKSYGGGFVDPAMLYKRGSIAMESDAGAESDSSMPSSIASGGPRRVDSPSADMSLSRVTSTRSRERKRQSLVLPSLAAGANRLPSPGRGPAAPASPLRMAKPRLPSGALSASDSVPSPITSPILSHSEFHSPVIRGQAPRHHRRQSSAAFSESLRRPGSPHLSGVVSNPQPRAPQTSIKDFEIIKPISKGAFGSVYLAKKKSLGDYYAIKVLKKADMVAKNQVTNVKAERQIMMWQGESDFVAKLYWTFSSKDYLYLVMEYLNGGDCASLIKVLGALPEDWTTKYIGEVVLCVQHLHSRQIVHRDLKPDNLLIDAKGHLKLTDFGLSRMGLIGRQKRAINASPDDAPPDLLKAGPFKRATSITSSRSTSFDFPGGGYSPAQTPALHPAVGNDLHQPSYFNLYRDSSTSRDLSRRTSGHRSDSADSDALSTAFRRISIAEGRTPIEEETHSEEGTPGEATEGHVLQPVGSNSSDSKPDTHAQLAMPPPAMALFDPEDSTRRFVGTPDYLAPETIKGAGQDEMSDWWSLGCILFECLYGRPPFNAPTPEEVFQNILNRRIHWPAEDEEDEVSAEAKDLMNKLMCLDPKERLGSNKDDKYANGGEEIKAHPWFSEINWDTLREDQASFVPASENPEDTEYFDARGASMENFAAEFEDQTSSPAHTPGADYLDRPHDALSHVRHQVNAAVRRSLMPLHIPPHVRDVRSRRLSEPVVADDFGNFQFKNLPVLEKANKDVIQKLRADAMQAQARTAAGTAVSSAAASPSPAPSLESSPILQMPLSRTLSATRGPRSHSPSVSSSQAESSPNRNPHVASPMLVQFSTGLHERRKTSSGSSHLSQQTGNPNSLQPGSFFDQPPRLPSTHKVPSNASSPVKGPRPTSINISMSMDRGVPEPRQSSVPSSRQRSHTLGSADGDLVPELVPSHHKRRSGVFDVSPSSSDNEDTRQKAALLRVHRRRTSSRRLSVVSLADGPAFRTLDVLICEDHPVSRLVMERLLEKLRCRTISVTTGTDAVQYGMSDVKFDIILMEYRLPHMNGTDVARMIRETHNPNARTPIVAVTGYLKELPATHHFDAMIEKPPTREKLEDVLAHLCQWKPAPEGWQPSAAQPFAQSSLRRESQVRDDSPTTTNSSGFAGFGPALSSSRGDSIDSSQTGETDSPYGSVPVIVSRQATGDFDQLELERNFGGLGISSEPKIDEALPDGPRLIAQSSAPAALGTPDAEEPTADPPQLRKQPSSEAIEAKRRSIEKQRQESSSTAESGDDEDEELGHLRSTRTRTRSPRRVIKRSSKLGTEMMRTNSQGSVVSTDEIGGAGATLDPSSSEKTHVAGGLSELDSTACPIIEESAAEVEAEGKLTPPMLFPREPGDHAVVFAMDSAAEEGRGSNADDVDVTPKPHYVHDDPDPTPKASSSPSHTD
ncbi:hypothetical protein BDY17DRAFT_284340 [Neohortaea acidophila]|uniref:non-specific serine/threonine protein kinase n=1 Tax=Neohortaea acidophila TaxID=245834 RepID=A0A6A6PLB1_9PEZI|nr:uncharacterized protein BDY17DRAFT_284340 [Neohortaea acidophila]KAF2480481.1 hypothetical protein BDY17DRAFT_284340 [Neohortaea acidophila]